MSLRRTSPSRPSQSSKPSQSSQSSKPSHSQPQSIVYTVYKAIMTPIIFVSFLVSLAWVEFRYSVLRGHSHDSDSTAQHRPGDDCRHAWMPAWLHHLVYRQCDFRYVVVPSETDRKDTTTRPYYHAMQRKLLKMESAEAFRIRTTVLAVMAGGAVVAVWGGVAGVRWLARQFCLSL